MHLCERRFHYCRHSAARAIVVLPAHQATLEPMVVTAKTVHRAQMASRAR